MTGGGFLSYLPNHITVTWSGNPTRCVIYYDDQRHDLGCFWSADGAAKAAEKYILAKGWFSLARSPAERKKTRKG